MVSLVNNVGRANVRQRWEDYVAADARSGVAWGTTSKPFAEMPDDRFGGAIGSIPGVTSYLADDNIGSAGGTITASTLRTGMVNGASAWTHLRNMRARRYFNSQGNSQLQIDTTNKAFMPNSGTYNGQGTVTAPTVPTAGPTTGNTITIGSASGNTGMEEYLDLMRAAYRAVRDTAVIRDITTCHYSCHYSCHGSRGRR